MVVHKGKWFRPRFTLAALLGLITIIAIPLSFVAQRRTWNLNRKTAYETLVAKNLVFGSTVTRQEKSNSVFGWWRQLLQEDRTPSIVAVNYGGPAKRGTGLAPIGDADLRLLAFFPEIKSIRIMGPTAVTDSGLRIVGKLPQLQSLWLHEMPGVTGEFIHDFGSASVLRTLELRLDDLRGENLMGLRNLGSLQTLSLESAAKLNEESLREVEMPGKIDDLTLLFNRSIPADPMIRWIRSCRLRRFQGCAMSAKAAQALESQVNLQSLILFDSPLVDEDLFFLSKYTRLHKLWLSAMPIRGKFLENVAGVETLGVLRLDNTLLDDASLGRLRKFRYLDELDLSWTPITGEGFSAMGESRWPSDLRLMGTEFSATGKAALCACAELGETRRMELPGNWTIEDFQYFIKTGRPPETAELPIGAALAAGSTMKKFYRYYSAGEECLRSLDSFANCPAEVMAPVLRLRELARAQLEEERRQTQEYSDLEALYYQSLRGLDAK